MNPRRLIPSRRYDWVILIAFIIVLLALVAFALSAQTPPAPDTNNYPTVTVAWNAPTDRLVTNGGGVNIYFGGASGIYTNKTACGLRMNLDLYNLTAGYWYYFAATTYSAAGAESALSLEVKWAFYAYAITNQTFQVWSGTNLLLNVQNPSWTQMFFRMSNGWFQAAARLNPAAWNNITHFSFTNAARLRATNIVSLQRTP